jgi:type IV secretory pathway VirB2 component (pilin)
MMKKRFNKAKAAAYLTLGNLLCMSTAQAEGDVGTIEKALKGLTDILMGNTAKAIAVIAIAGMGYMTISGKMAWQKAILICFGIGIIFGAKTIAGLLGAG